jgi:hypothetical protein
MGGDNNALVFSASGVRGLLSSSFPRETSSNTDSRGPMSSVERVVKMPDRALTLVTPIKALPQDQSPEGRNPVMPILLIGAIAFFGAVASSVR